MKKRTNHHVGLVLIVITTFTFVPSSARAQGGLTPSGPPAPTMKALDQIDPGFPIGTSPTNLTVSGAYYLTANLLAPVASYAITISADDVSLDLRGFTITGTNSSHGGIMVASNGAAIFNGFIRNCGNGSGVNAAPSHGCRFERLILSGNLGGLEAGSHSIVRDCIARQNTGPGIIFHNANLIRDNLCAQNVNGGFYAYGVDNRLEGNQVISNAYAQIVAANGDASNNLVICNSFKGDAPLIVGVVNWAIAPMVNSASLATNSNPYANFDLNQ